MSAKDLKELLEHLDDTHEIVVLGPVEEPDDEGPEAPARLQVDEARRYVLRSAGFLRCGYFVTGALSRVGDLLHGSHQAADLAIDVPVLAAAFAARFGQRAIFLIGFVDVVPGVLRFDDTGIGIDDRHTI